MDASPHSSSTSKTRLLPKTTKSKMVVPLGPGKFYGSSLPRPRIYTDTVFNSERVDPPLPVTDPLLSWANEAHWSMGGLSFKRLRLQGRIEGSVTKLRKEREKLFKSQADHTKTASSSVPSPPAPVAVKRRRFLADLSDDDEEEQEEEVAVKEKVSYRRKLEDDFNKVANESPAGVRTRSRGSTSPVVAEKAVSKQKKKAKKEIRSSPRLAKRF